MSDEQGISDAFGRRDALERRRGTLADEIAELKGRVNEARKDAGKQEALALKAEYGDDFMDWAGKGFMGGMFSWVPLIAIAVVAAIATGDCSTDEHWKGSVLRSTNPEMPVASLCEVVAGENSFSSGRTCRVSVRCGPGEGYLVLREAVRCHEEDRGEGDNTNMVLVVGGDDETMWLDEGRGVGRIGPKDAPEVEILLHHFDVEGP